LSYVFTLILSGVDRHTNIVNNFDIFKIKNARQSLGMHFKGSTNKYSNYNLIYTK